MFHQRTFVSVAAGLVLLATVVGTPAQDRRHQPSPAANTLVTANPSGWQQTSTPSGSIDTANPFFQSFGPNGRSCDSCHRQAQGWSITPDELRQRFASTNGNDPIFRLVDGAVSGLAKGTVASGDLARRPQTGYVRSYASTMLLGLVALVVVVLALQS